MFQDLKSQYRQSLKSSDTEENIDLAFYRPLGFAWAYLFRRLGVTPNVVTVFSIFLGVGAGVCFYYQTLWINLLGMFLLVWANTYDSCDGQLARLTGNYSRLGRILDGLSGDLWFASIYVAICLRMVHTPGFFADHHWVIWTLAVAAGIAHGKQASMADCYRQFHLFIVKGAAGSELENLNQLEQRYRYMSWKRQFWSKIFLHFYVGYTRGQAKSTPTLQQLRTVMSETYPDGVPSEAFRRDFRASSRPLMKYTNILTFNWRTITLFITLLAGVPWVYFVAELTVFFAIMYYMKYRHEAICRHYIAAIRAGQYPPDNA